MYSLPLESSGRAKLSGLIATLTASKGSLNCLWSYSEKEKFVENYTNCLHPNLELPILIIFQE